MTLEKENYVILKQTKLLSEFLAKTTIKDIPESVINRAKLTIADTVGIMIYGSNEPEMEKLYKLLPCEEEAFIFKENFPKTTISTASFANTTAACFVELDELSSSGGHSAVHVLPPALALAQKLNTSGSSLVTAFILGYEVQDRIQTASKLRDGVYPHGNSGHIGATVAVGKLLGWNAEQFRQGINCAASLPLGTSYTPTFDGSSIVTTFASLSGPVAFIVKDLVESGFTGYDDALGDTFGNILGKEFNPLALTEGLGVKYGIVDNNFKFHANCGMIHPALEAVADALGFTIQHDVYPPYKAGIILNAKDVKSIRVIQGTDRGRRVMTYPHNKLAAKFSLPYSLAAFLITGDVGVGGYNESVLGDPEIKLLEKLVEFEVDPSIVKSNWGAKIVIQMKDGQIFEGKRDDIYGHSMNPSSLLDLQNKFYALTKELFDREKVWTLWDMINDLENEKQVNSVFKYIKQQ